MKEIVLGLLGLGNIGGGVWDLIREFGDETAKRTGVKLRVKKALVLDKKIHEAKDQLEKARASIRSFEELAGMMHQYIDEITLTRELAELLIDRIYVDAEQRDGFIASEKVGDHSVEYRAGSLETDAAAFYAAARMYLTGTGLLYSGVPVMARWGF